MHAEPNIGLLGGKVVIVTGGAGGIGSAIAKQIAAESGFVVVNDLPGRADAVVAEINETEQRDAACTAPGDISNEADVEGVIAAAVRAFGRLDGLVNNATAANPDDRDIANMDVATWQARQNIGLLGPMLGCKYAVRQLLAQNSGGSIINVSSTAAYQGDYRFSGYSAAKAGMLQLTRSVATQYGKRGIRCNTVVPGCVVTPTQAAHMSSADILLSTRLTPRLGVPADVAHLVTFLLSDRAEYITGQDWRVDGGGSSHQPWVPHLTPAPV